MTTGKLIDAVAEQTGFPKSHIRQVLKSAAKVIAESMIDGRRVRLKNFGVFEVSKRKAKIGRDIYRGIDVEIPEKKKMVFRPGKSLNDLINNGRF